MISPKRSIGGGGTGMWGFVGSIAIRVTGFCRATDESGFPCVGRVITVGLFNSKSSVGGFGGVQGGGLWADRGSGF